MLLAMVIFVPPALAIDARVDSLNNLGHNYLFSNVTASIQLYSDLADETHLSGYEKGEAMALQNLAAALALKGLYDRSIEAQLKAIRLLGKNRMLEDLAGSYGDLGYRIKTHNLELAQKYMREGIRIGEANDFKIRLCGLYDNFGVLQEMAAKPDSAAFYYEKSLQLKFSLNDSIGIPFSLNNLASLNATLGNFQLADSLLTLSDNYHEAANDSYGRLVNNVHWGDLYFSQGDLDNAEIRYQRALTLPGASEQSFLVIHCYQQLALLYEQKKDFMKAYTSQQRFTAYRDSLVTVETNARIAGLEIEFESEKKDRQLVENQLAMEASKRHMGILVGLAILLAAIGGGILRFQQLKRKQMRREMELRGQLRRSEYDQRMADEKLRISRELHDNIGSQLTFLVSSVDNASLTSEEPAIQQKLKSISEFGHTTLSELRHTVWAMKHGESGLSALVVKLNELKRQCACGDLQLNLEFDENLDKETTLSSVRMLNIYRITQEAVQNAVKHSQAEKTTIKLAINNGELLLSIVDNGRGFDQKNPVRQSGLSNMKNRCLEAGGKFVLESQPTGTRISCRFPLE